VRISDPAQQHLFDRWPAGARPGSHRKAGAPPPDSRAFLARLLRRHRRLRFRPGETAACSNLGYIVLGELIASCAGQSFCEFVQRELLDALGMSRTGFEHAQAPADIVRWCMPAAVTVVIHSLGLPCRAYLPDRFRRAGPELSPRPGWRRRH
jgi:CubicO group peptidase (beta-lactamase class C family)